MELRKAEMEAAKAENMVEHEAEIHARPARTWFQTKKEKEAAVTRSGLADNTSPFSRRLLCSDAGLLAVLCKSLRDALRCIH